MTTHLKGAYHDNPRVHPLVEGAVQVEGDYAFEWELGHASILHGRHLKENSFDVFEFSFSNLVITKDKPERAHLRWQAIPIHLLWANSMLQPYARNDSGIKTFADLKGKRLGIPDYQMTAAVWLRIILREMYGIMPQDIRWVNGRRPSQTHGDNVTDSLAPGIELRRLEEHESLDDLLQRGEIDVAFGDGRGTPVFESDVVTALPWEAARTLLAEFRAKTGKRPVNHVLMIQEAVAQEHPELPMALYRALEQSKQIAYQRARAASDALLLFPDLSFKENAERFGEDPFPSGLKANRSVLESVIEELELEGLTKQRIQLESLFHPSTLDT